MQFSNDHLRAIFESYNLSDAQCRVAFEMLTEDSASVIAKKIKRSVSTVRTHKDAVFKKFDVHNRGDFINKVYDLIK
jgi:DNA-binding CsgD family transcriptional regulator